VKHVYAPSSRSTFPRARTLTRPWSRGRLQLTVSPTSSIIPRFQSPHTTPFTPRSHRHDHREEEALQESARPRSEKDHGRPKGRARQAPVFRTVRASAQGLRARGVADPEEELRRSAGDPPRGAREVSGGRRDLR